MFTRAYILSVNDEEFEAMTETQKEALLKAAYKQGYREGRRAQKLEVTRRSSKRLGRPPKYEFSTIKVGKGLFTTESNTRRIYIASRKWAQHNAPERRFRVQPVTDGSVITRVA